MRCEKALILSRRRRLNYIAERLIGSRTTKSARFPFSQVLHGLCRWRFSIHEPRFPHRTRHYAYIAKLLICGFGAVSTAHGHDQSDNFPSAFKTCIRQRSGHDVRQKRIGRDDDMRAWHGFGNNKSRVTQRRSFAILPIAAQSTS